jgi:hypothetical protein
MRIARWDTLESKRDPRDISPPWPEGHRPDGDAPPDDGAWDRGGAAFSDDPRAMQELAADPATVPCTPLPHGGGRAVPREALLVGDHVAHHLGPLGVVGRLLAAWEEEG